jgi:hypothetical protein
MLLESSNAIQKMVSTEPHLSINLLYRVDETKLDRKIFTISNWCLPRLFYKFDTSIQTAIYLREHLLSNEHFRAHFFMLHLMNIYLRSKLPETCQWSINILLYSSNNYLPQFMDYTLSLNVIEYT